MKGKPVGCVEAAEGETGSPLHPPHGPLEITAAVTDIAGAEDVVVGKLLTAA